MGANVSTACCNKGDTASIPSETVRAAGADAENPAADPDAKASEDGEVGEVGEVDEVAATHRLKVMKSLGHLEVDEEILRKTLRGFGRVWQFSPSDLPLKEREALWKKSASVKSLAFFISHTWRTAGRWKVLALLLRTSWAFVILCWACCMSMVVCLYALEVLPRPLTAPDVGILGLTLTYHSGPWLLVAHVPSILLGFALAPYFPSLKNDQSFLDVTCIHQEDQALMERGVYGLGGFLARSKKLLILWSQPYLSRLWCVFEIAAYRAANPEGEIELAPIFVELTVLVLWVMIFCSTCLSYAVSFTPKYFWVAMPFALVPQLVAAHFLRRLISQKHRLIESMANFDVDKAECREEFDRKFVMTAIDAWYGSREAFNQYVQGPVRNELLQKRSTQIPSAYFLLLIAAVSAPSFEVFIGFCLDGFPADVLWIRVLSKQIGFFFASQMVTLKILLYLCDRFAMPPSIPHLSACPRVGGLCDFLQTVLIYLSYILVDLGSYAVCRRSQGHVWSAALYCSVMLFLAGLLHGCCRRRCV